MNLHFYEPKSISEAISFQEKLPRNKNSRYVYALEVNDLVYISIGKKVDKVRNSIECF